jgi:hypothetical protein
MAAQLPAFFDTYRVYQNAEQLLREREFHPAMWEFLTVLEEYDSVPVVMSALEAAMGAQDFNAAWYIFDVYLVGKEVSDEQYARAMYFDDFLERYYNTVNLIEEIEELDDVRELHAYLYELLKRDDIDPTYLYYVLYLTTEEQDKRMEYLQLACTLDERVTYPLAFYGNELRRVGDFEAAMAVYNNALMRNAHDTYALRGVGILMQLQGDIAGGLSVIQETYDKNPYELYINEALIIALCENNQRDAAMAVMQAAIEEGYDFDYDHELQDYLDGTITMHQFYTE